MFPGHIAALDFELDLIAGTKIRQQRQKRKLNSGYRIPDTGNILKL